MNNVEWLQSLKPGDEVAVSVGYVGDRYDITKVTRITATIIMVGTSRYNRATGARIGNSRGFYRTYIVRPTDEMRLANAAAALKYKLEKLDTKKLSAEQVAALDAFLDDLDK